MCIKAAPEGEDVQLVEFGDLLQELLAVRPQPRVQHGLPSAQLEVENSLQECEESVSFQQSNLAPCFNKFRKALVGVSNLRK